MHHTVVCVDFETALESGEASVEFYRPDFRVVSCAVSGAMGDQFVVGERDIFTLLLSLHYSQTPLVVHNLQFEMGVVMHRFPSLSLNWHADTQRLAQLADKGGVGRDEDAEGGQGYKLTACAERWVKMYQDHKAPFYEILREQGVKKGKEGANLHLLSPSQLEAYNIADTRTTLALYDAITAYFTRIEYDWTFDHFFYSNMAYQISKARGRGVLIDQEGLRTSIDDLQVIIKGLYDDFYDTFRPQIEIIESEKINKMISLLKTEKGKEKARIRIEEKGLHKFSINSAHDKEALFCGQLGLTPKFFTDKGAPSFAKQFLGQWGEGGKLLKARGTTAITLAQCETLLLQSELDGRYHVDLKAVGTATGRNAGAGGLNVQGLARKEKRLMGCLVADPGHVLVSVDLSAGEPTATTHYSKDANYRAATFDMVGQKPYYQDGVLMIDDIYLMGMSVSPMGKAKMRQFFDTYVLDGQDFPTVWVSNPDAIKQELKTDRAFHKILILGLGYGMGPKHMVESAHKAGFELHLKDARAFFREYWALFHDVQRFGERLEQRFLAQGYLVNDFGYRLLPDPAYKSLNYFIQSTVTGIMNALSYKFFTACQDAQFVTVIHDELIFQVPESKKEQARTLWSQAVDSLNQELNWDVKIRTGWVEGRTMYEAK